MAGLVSLRPCRDARRLPVLGSRFPVLGSRFSVLSCQCPVLSSQVPVASSRFSVLSCQVPVPSSRQFSVASSQLRNEYPLPPVFRKILKTKGWNLKFPLKSRFQRFYGQN